MTGHAHPSQPDLTLVALHRRSHSLSHMCLRFAGPSNRSRGLPRSGLRQIQINVLVFCGSPLCVDHSLQAGALAAIVVAAGWRCSPARPVFGVELDAMVEGVGVLVYTYVQA